MGLPTAILAELCNLEEDRPRGDFLWGPVAHLFIVLSPQRGGHVKTL